MHQMSALRYIARRQGLPESKASMIAATRLSNNAATYARKHGILYHQCIRTNPHFVQGFRNPPKMKVNIYPEFLLELIYEKLWPGD